MKTGALTLSRWQKDKSTQEGECPWCKVKGFWGYYIDGRRHYRLCKWCGTLQKIK